MTASGKVIPPDRRRRAVAHGAGQPGAHHSRPGRWLPLGRPPTGPVSTPGLPMALPGRRGPQPCRGRTSPDLSDGGRLFASAGVLQAGIRSAPPRPWPRATSSPGPAGAAGGTPGSPGSQATLELSQGFARGRPKGPWLRRPEVSVDGEGLDPDPTGGAGRADRRPEIVGS